MESGQRKYVVVNVDENAQIKYYVRVNHERFLKLKECDLNGHMKGRTFNCSHYLDKSLLLISKDERLNLDVVELSALESDSRMYKMFIEMKESEYSKFVIKNREDECKIERMI